MQDVWQEVTRELLVFLATHGMTHTIVQALLSTPARILLGEEPLSSLARSCQLARASRVRCLNHTLALAAPLHVYRR